MHQQINNNIHGKPLFEFLSLFLGLFWCSINESIISIHEHNYHMVSFFTTQVLPKHNSVIIGRRVEGPRYYIKPKPKHKISKCGVQAGIWNQKLSGAMCHHGPNGALDNTSWIRYEVWGKPVCCCVHSMYSTSPYIQTQTCTHTIIHTYITYEQTNINCNNNQTDKQRITKKQPQTKTNKYPHIHYIPTYLHTYTILVS